MGEVRIRGEGECIADRPAIPNGAEPNIRHRGEAKADGRGADKSSCPRLGWILSGAPEGLPHQLSRTVDTAKRPAPSGRIGGAIRSKCGKSQGLRVGRKGEVAGACRLPIKRKDPAVTRDPARGARPESSLDKDVALSNAAFKVSKPPEKPLPPRLTLPDLSQTRVPPSRRKRWGRPW